MHQGLYRPDEAAMPQVAMPNILLLRDGVARL